MSPASPYEVFRNLHARPHAFIMPNAWDGASAALLKEAGFEALGSSSLAIAFALGRHDGRHAVSRSQAIANAVLLARVSGLPVNGDLEDGFGAAPADCVATVETAVEAGLAGLGIEDSTADPRRPIHELDAAVSRIREAAKAARGRILLTARADNFLHGIHDLDDTLERLAAFADAGADVLYAPGLPDLEAIQAAVRAVAPKPLNVLIGPRSGAVPLNTLSELGVRRVSLGGALYRSTMTALVEAARRLRAGDLGAGTDGVSIDEIDRLLPPSD